MRLNEKSISTDMMAGSAADDRKAIAPPCTCPLDLSTVKRTSNTTPRTRPRIFGLQEAPTYYPTELEFKDPIRYIQSIRPEAEKFGIVKIVPPDTYKPGFAIDTKDFRFKTRVQKLNSMEGETRANVNYLEQLYKFHRLHGHPINKVPQLDKRPIDLFRLKKEVARRGGYQKVTKQKKWAEIGRDLGYTRKQCTSMSNALKSAFGRIILPYEIWLMEHKEEVEAHTTTTTFMSSSSPDSSYATSSPTPPPTQSLSSSTTNTAPPTNEIGQVCEICNTGDNEDSILLCDGCDSGYHMYCLNPPLQTVPKSDWFCVKCLTASGRDYGFEDGSEYSLESFQKLCTKFKTDWFANKQQHRDNITEEDCEDEFWRLVENPHETCQVEYGADLHSTMHGSGFPPIEGGGDDNVAHRTGNALWNLNVLPVLPDSLFTHIKTDISGMMVPWLYVGMCFSAFCWHNEDHYTYSINYMHFGETKTWYGVPGSDTAKFEATMRAAVPELFEQQPDLLFELVTMLSPERLIKENVKVYAVDQRPGQFVVTFPKAYHSGFNHGFNFCEAVNFAPLEWIEHGLECVNLYKKYRRQPCFSHDELLVTTANADHSPQVANWLQGALMEMQQRETKERRDFLKKYPNITRIIEDKSLSENLQQCDYCHCYVYLSRVTCECNTKAGCLDHMTELCHCDISKKTLTCRYSDEQLEMLVRTVTQRTNMGTTAWNDMAKQVLSEDPNPSLQTMQRLLQDAKQQGASVRETRWLQIYVDKVTQWLNEANKYIVRRSAFQSKATVIPSHDNEFYTGERYKRIGELLDMSTTIAFQPPEIDQLRDTYDRLTQYRNDMIQTLDKQYQDIHSQYNTFKTLLGEGMALGGDFPEMLRLKKIVDRKEWYDEAASAIQNPSAAVNVLDKLVSDATHCKIPHDDSTYLALKKRQGHTTDWMSRARHMLNGSRRTHPVTRQEIQQLVEDGKRLPKSSMHNKVHSLANSALDVIEQIDEILGYARDSERLADRPGMKDLHRVLKLAHALPIKVEGTDQLQDEAVRMDGWIGKVRKIFSSIQHGKTFDATVENLADNVKRVTRDTIGVLHNDAAMEQDLYCFCHGPESGLMIECDVCHEWYHSTCVNMLLKDAELDQSFICTICDKTIIKRYIGRINADDLITVVDDAEQLLFVPKIFPILSDMVMRFKLYRSRLQTFCNKEFTTEDLPIIKKYLRGIEGLKISMDDEANLLQNKMLSIDFSNPPQSPMQQPKQEQPETPRNQTTPTLQSQHVPKQQDDVPLKQPQHESSPPQMSPKQELQPKKHNSFRHHPKHNPWLPKTAAGPFQSDVYCVCQRVFNMNEATSPMIGCDICHGWFHIECVNFTRTDLLSMNRYSCMECISKKRLQPSPSIATAPQQKSPIMTNSSSPTTIRIKLNRTQLPSPTSSSSSSHTSLPMTTTSATTTNSAKRRLSFNSDASPYQHSSPHKQPKVSSSDSSSAHPSPLAAFTPTSISPSNP
ncbi:hypothetical protein K492DRAFT_205018 [Lichtheimia hyalospora FSU 10163]|nr:hypothetical protein K492DRAFT_205018 [Lichtheimia hyalospora FSU 10163]